MRSRRPCDPNAEAFPSAGNGGLTKREWLTGMVAQGLLSSGLQSADDAQSRRRLARISKLTADTLIKRLNEGAMHS